MGKLKEIVQCLTYKRPISLESSNLQEVRPLYQMSGLQMRTLILKNQLKQSYPDNTNVQRIYALAYAQCLACRINNDKPSCIAGFNQIIASSVEKPAGFAPSPELDQQRQDAEAYHQQVLQLLSTNTASPQP